MNKCKYCQSINIEHKDEPELITYKGQNLNILVGFSICRQCGREFLSKSQILTNEARVRDAKKKVDGLLTSHEIYEARVKLGLTQEQASIVFGGGKNAFSKYERAEVSQSLAMDRLIRICLRHPKVFQELLSTAGV